MRAWRKVLGAAAAVVALAACSGIPTEGPVVEGDSEVTEPDGFLPILQGPAVGASPNAIVTDFIAASAGGAVTGFDVAREFLTDEAAREWDPLAKVTIFDSRQLASSYDEATGVFTFSVPVAATVNAAGVMTEATADQREELRFTVVDTGGGRYRIDSLEDGIIIFDESFVRLFRPLELTFATPDGTTRVPELRWLPDNDQLPTSAARELVAGASPWLADAVITGFPPSSSLALDAVVVTDGLADVRLAAGSAGTADERALAAAQMRATLRESIAVQDVVTTVGGVPLVSSVDEVAVLEPAPLPRDEAVVIAGGAVGLWTGATGEFLRVPASAGRIPEGVDTVALDYRAEWFAMVVDGDAVVSDALSTTALVVAEVPPAADEPPAEGGAGEEDGPGLLPTTVLVDGDDLAALSYDRYGWLWTAETVSDGMVVAARPGDEPVVLDAGAWLSGRIVESLAVSRDGSRLAVLSRAGGQQVLEVAAIARSEDGVPIALGGEPLELGLTARPSIDLAWVDTTTVALVGEEAGEVALARVGGRTEVLSSLSGAQSLTARFGEQTMIALDGDGGLFGKVGTGWVNRASGVQAVAFGG